MNEKYMNHAMCWISFKNRFNVLYTKVLFLAGTVIILSLEMNSQFIFSASFQQNIKRWKLGPNKNLTMEDKMFKSD